ncbi:hypothetical protein [Saccharopolyspora taberi]|uniref:DUF3800 domain-containing protein n=1 Tax=Saccharopolyspora taberi TaxID=60895 RepID=A0ABN3VP73_9PSEU
MERFPPPSDWRFAHLDESSSVHNRQRIYAIAAVLSTEGQHAELKERLRSALLPGQDHLHWNADRSLARRLELAHLIAECEIEGVLVVSSTTTNKQQEHARKKILGVMLPELQHREAASHVIIESRFHGDTHDRRTVGWLRQQHVISSQMLVDHVPKREDERLWLADALVSSYMTATVHGQTGPWDVINSGQRVAVLELG